MAGARVSAQSLAAFLRHLAACREAGLPLLDAVRDYQDPSRPLRRAAADMAARLAGGASLSAAMAAHPGLFPPVQVAMIRAGEAMGRLDPALQAAIGLAERDAGIRAQIRQAACQPLILSGVLAAAGTLVAVVSLPEVLRLMAELKVPVPAVTRVFLAAGGGLARHGWLLAAGLLALGAGLGAALRLPAFRLHWDSALLALPGAGALITRMALARFAHMLCQQYRAGIPLVQALRHSEAVLGNARLAQSLGALRRGVERGEPLAAMAARSGQFPGRIVQMLATAEAAGRLDEALERAARQLDADAAALARRMLLALDPALKILMAGGLVFVASAILLPFYTLIGGLHE